MDTITILRNVNLTSVILYYEVTADFSLCHNVSYGKCVNNNRVANTDGTVKAGLTQYVLIFQKVAATVMAMASTEISLCSFVLNVVVLCSFLQRSATISKNSVTNRRENSHNLVTEAWQQ